MIMHTALITRKKFALKNVLEGELVRDLNRVPTQRLIASWVNFKGTEECPLKEQQDGNDHI